MSMPDGDRWRAKVQKQDDPLTERTAQLAAANEELAAFSYSISHDLRAPLRAITGFSNALFEDYASRLDAEGLDYLRRVREAAVQMEVFIEAIVEYSRVSRADLRREPVDLTAIADAIAVEIAASDPSRSARFSIERDLMITGDPALLTTCFQHLMKNSWKFTSHHPSARIEVGAENKAGRRVIYVRDDGAGFGPTNTERLFGPFQRLHPENEFAGTGMGLAIVRRIINRHGGRVWATGEVEKGATVYIELA